MQQEDRKNVQQFSQSSQKKKRSPSNSQRVES